MILYKIKEIILYKIKKSFLNFWMIHSTKYLLDFQQNYLLKRIIIRLFESNSNK
jgi:hypothetical protein